MPTYAAAPTSNAGIATVALLLRNDKIKHNLRVCSPVEAGKARKNTSLSAGQKFYAFEHNFVDYFVFNRIVDNLSVALAANYA